MLDLLTLTATKAQQLLQNGETTSVALVEAYLAQIEKHNHNGMHLNAMISVRPRELLFAEAKRLDVERKAGRVCGPLHGIPFVFKDIFALHPDMGIPVTCGAPCFQSAKPRRTAPLIQHLTNNCGLIALGTANMTEFCGLKFDKLTVGSSPAGGQTQSPYIYGGLETDTKYVVGHSSIGGSSAGSASAVAAGFASLSIGTECCGSLVLPASRGAIYGLKCGLDMVDVRGAFHFTDVTDYIGGMAKSPSDLAPFVAALMGRTDSFDISQGLKGLRVGFVDPETWLLPDEYMDYPGDSKQQMIDAFRESQRRFAQAGADVFEKIDLSSDSDAFDYKGKNLLWEISIYQMRNKSFPAWFNEFEESEVHSVADMIKWNVDHAEQCLPLKQPYQNHFYDLLHNRISAEECDEFIDAFHKYGDKMNKLFDEMDIIASFTDSGLARYTSAAGSPSACAPLTTVKYSEQNERPLGLCFAARKGNEGLLLRCLAGFEELYPNRPLPKPMMEG